MSESWTAFDGMMLYGRCYLRFAWAVLLVQKALNRVARALLKLSARLDPPFDSAMGKARLLQARGRAELDRRRSVA